MLDKNNPGKKIKNQKLCEIFEIKKKKNQEFDDLEIFLVNDRIK